jgi:hypothetical protein
MYAVGVTDFSAFSRQGGAGVYLFGQESGGWGLDGQGAQDKFEGLGQNRGRWFCPIPFGITPSGEYPSVVTYNGRTYLCGGYSYNLILDEHHRIWKQGIRPPEETPNITGGGAGSTVLAYFTWFDELTNERSPLSKAATLGATTPRTWNNLPTRPPDDVATNDDLIQVATPGGAGVYPAVVRHPYNGRIIRTRPGDRFVAGVGPFAMMVNGFGTVTNVAPAPAPSQPCYIAEPWAVLTGAPPAVSACTILPVTRATHLELWLSVAGDLPRLAMRVPIGTTTVVESKGIGDLGEAFITQFQRFPRCTMNTIYHDRQIMAGDSENPDTVYLSSLFQPERFEGLSFRTRDSKAITGILSTRDFCMVFTRSSAFLLQGYTDTDYTFVPVDQSLGAVGHHCNVVIHGNPYVWTEKGPFMYNGGWHPLSPENRWVPPSRAASMIATEDPYFNTYIVSQAYRAAYAQQEPFATWRDSGAWTDEWDPALVQPDSLDEIHKYFAVLDYTLVQAETGGAMVPARLSWDSTDWWTTVNESPPDTAHFNNEVFMKYLRGRYGKGNLYRIWSRKQVDPLIPPGVSEWAAALPSFTVGGMLLPQSEQQLNLVPEEDSQIITAFDYMGDGGGYLMEQKQIKRVWYYMRMESGKVQLFVAPGPGYWGSRKYPALAGPIEFDTTFAAGEYRGGVVEADHADVIMPVLPDFLSGRGMWLRLRGKKFFFVGYGVETIWGSEVIHDPIP